MKKILIIIFFIGFISCKNSKKEIVLDVIQNCNSATWGKGGKYEGMKLINSPNPTQGHTYKVSLDKNGTRFISDRWLLNSNNDTIRIICSCDSLGNVINLKEVSTDRNSYLP